MDRRRILAGTDSTLTRDPRVRVPDRLLRDAMATAGTGIIESRVDCSPPTINLQYTKISSPCFSPAMFASLSQQQQDESPSSPSSTPSSSPISWSEAATDRPTGYPITFALSPISTGNDSFGSGDPGPIAVVDVSCDDISKKIEACMVSPSSSKSTVLSTCDNTIKFFCNMCMKS